MTNFIIVLLLILTFTVGYGVGTVEGIHAAGRFLQCTSLETSKIPECKALYLDTWYRG